MRGVACLAMLLSAIGCDHAPGSDDASVPDAAVADAPFAPADLAFLDESVASDLTAQTDLAAALCVPTDGGMQSTDGGGGGAPPLADVARVCALAASCSRDLNASQCVDDLIHAWPQDPVAARLVSCIGASDCPSLYNCFGGTLLNTTVLEQSGACDGTALVGVDGHRFECCSLGLTCVRDSVFDDLTYCANACPPNMPSSFCAGNVLLSCSDGVLLPTDCVALDGVCQNGQCVGTGAPCDPMTAEPSCNGTIATLCLGGHWQSHDCNDGSLRNGCDGGFCWRAVDGDDCLTGNVECAGDQLKVCTNFKWVAIDCPSLGFLQGCGPGPMGALDALCK